MGIELLLLIGIACCLVYLATSYRANSVGAGVAGIALLLVLILLFNIV